eukprot:gene32-14_t
MLLSSLADPIYIEIFCNNYWFELYHVVTTVVSAEMGTSGRELERTSGFLALIIDSISLKSRKVESLYLTRCHIMPSPGVKAQPAHREAVIAPAGLSLIHNFPENI